MIDKKTFVNALKAIEEQYDLIGEINDALSKHGDCGAILSGGQCADAIIDLLHEIFKEADEEEWISYFVFDLNFGKNFHKGTVLCKDGSEIDLFTAEDLYDFLISEQESKKTSASTD